MMRRILTTICILLLLTSIYSFAATISSNGTGGGLWNATTTWAGGVVPVDGDDIIIVLDDVVVIDGSPDIPNDGDGVYTDVTILIDGGTLLMDNNSNVNNESCCANLHLAGNSGIRLDNDGQIVEDIPTPNEPPFGFPDYREGYGTITLDGEVIWVACDDDEPFPSCRTYVTDLSGYTLHPDLIYGDQIGDGLLIPATSNPLPIELVSFTAQVQDKSVLLKWITSSELNNDYFMIERSVNGLDFHELATIPGAGNSSESLNYTYTDKNPFFGISYYRLKQTDYDGQFEYFNTIVIMLDHGLQKLGFTIFPNPTNDNVYVQITGNAVLDTKIELYNAQGQMVDYSVSSNNIDGFELDVAHLNAGIYLVHLINEKYQGVRKFYKR